MRIGGLNVWCGRHNNLSGAAKNDRQYHFSGVNKILTVVAIAACNGAANNLADKNNMPLGQSSAPSADCRTVSHNMGEIKICGQPQTLAVLGANLLEMLLALDVQPAGFAGYFELSQANYDNPGQQIPYLGDRISPNPLMPAKPDESTLFQFIYAEVYLAPSALNFISKNSKSNCFHQTKP